MAEQSNKASTSKQPADLGTDSTLAFYSLVDWFEKNRSKVFIALAILAVVVLGIYGQKSMAAASEEEASHALSRVNDKIDFTDPEKGPSGDDYLAVAAEHAGTEAAARALVLAGSAFFDDKDFGKARDAFQRFLSEYPGKLKVVRENATYGLARSEESLGNSSAALKHYQSLTDAYQPTVAEASKFAAARLLEASGDLKAAYVLFDQISLGTGYSYWTREASVRKQEILKKDPSVKPAETASAEIDLAPSAE